MKKILIVDNCNNLSNISSDILNDNGYEAIIKTDEESALNTIEQYPDFQLIVVNIVLPEADSLKFCRKIQHIVRCPIIYTPIKDSALNNIIGLDNIIGLEMFENDYIFKPVLIDDFVGRVKSHIRDNQLKTSNSNFITSGPLEIRTESSEVFKDGHKIDLSPLEYKLLLFFISNKEKTLTNEQLINCVWGVADGDKGMLRVAIKRLRNKIDPNNDYIITKRGIGYKFTIPK